MKERKFLYIPDILIITGVCVFILLDSFLIPHAYDTAGTGTSAVKTGSTSASITDTSYKDDHISITLNTYRIDDTDVYVADVTVDDPQYLKTILADNTYGRNITEKTSTMAVNNNVILAINGDYYGARNAGYVVRNGKVYRNTVNENGQEDLMIDKNGDFSIITEGGDASELDNAQQVFSFGPSLINDGEISVSQNEEVDQAMASNPRTAIAQTGENHYLFVVSDGRTSESKGLTLYQLAEFLKSLDAETAYNLDGGGSSTMVFNGHVINKPTTNGHNISERKVSDIVCISY